MYDNSIQYTRSRKRVNPQIFDYENNPEARRLRDEGIKEVAEKFAEKNRLAAEERRAALGSRRKALEEKNRLAAENERLREEEKREKRLQSEKALSNLVESRKRRR